MYELPSRPSEQPTHNCSQRSFCSWRFVHQSKEYQYDHLILWTIRTLNIPQHLVSDTSIMFSNPYRHGCLISLAVDLANNVFKWQLPAPQHFQSEPNNYPRFDAEGLMDEMSSASNFGGHLHSGFNLPSPSGRPDVSNPRWPQQLPRDFARQPQRTISVTSSFDSDISRLDASVEGTRNLQYDHHDEIPHPDVMRRRNTSYQRPYRQSDAQFNNPDRRHSTRSADGSAFLSGLGTSPRNQNRRSFDRYSANISSGANGPNGQTRSASSHSAGTSCLARAMYRGSMVLCMQPYLGAYTTDMLLNGSDRMPRRQRIMGHPGFRRIPSHVEHPNVPSVEQMRELRERLRHIVRTELPEGIDPICDICQKDYSTKHAESSEDNEVAVQLPCKHVFGEHCINTWVRQLLAPRYSA